jgi:hypothetical protein
MNTWDEDTRLLITLPLRQQHAALLKLLSEQVAYARWHSRDPRLAQWLDAMARTHAAGVALRRQIRAALEWPVVARLYHYTTHQALAQVRATGALLPRKESPRQAQGLLWCSARATFAGDATGCRTPQARVVVPPTAAPLTWLDLMDLEIGYAVAHQHYFQNPELWDIEHHPWYASLTPIRAAAWLGIETWDAGRRQWVPSAGEGQDA